MKMNNPESTAKINVSCKFSLSNCQPTMAKPLPSISYKTSSLVFKSTAKPLISVHTLIDSIAREYNILSVINDCNIKAVFIATKSFLRIKFPFDPSYLNLIQYKKCYIHNNQYIKDALIENEVVYNGDTNHEGEVNEESIICLHTSAILLIHGIVLS